VIQPGETSEIRLTHCQRPLVHGSSGWEEIIGRCRSVFSCEIPAGYQDAAGFHFGAPAPPPEAGFEI
jgi:hypothetical protein